MKLISCEFPEVKLIEPKVFGDTRGFFFESFQVNRYREIGITHNFVQDNISHSKHGVLRGLHYQLKNPQGKLVMVLKGEVFDVIVDIRMSSPTFGKWMSVVLNDTNHRQLYIPPGFAHGFCVLSEQADFYYKCTDYYNPKDEFGIIWNDPKIAINWPTEHNTMIVSPKDQLYKTLEETPAEYLP